jgi:high-affinity K+ transport system ATPase subunit B
MIRTPIMFVVEIGSMVTTIYFLPDAHRTFRANRADSRHRWFPR